MGKKPVLLFDTVEEFLTEVVRRKYYSYKFYAHNGGKFDFLALFEILNHEYPLKILQAHGRLIQIQVEVAERRYIYFRDSFSLFPVGLKKLTEAFGVTHAKKEIDFDKEQFDPENPLHIEYLEYDVIGLHECLTLFFNSPKINDIKPRLTEGSTALAVFRTTLAAPIKTPPKNIQNFTRNAYYGGRVEIFRHEGDDLNLYDVNSIFPWVMRTKPLPIEYLGRASDVTEFGFHDVTIFVPDMYIPPLPLRREKLFFPCGTFRGVFFSEEIKAAILLGAKVITYHSGETFSETNDMFNEYIDFFYDMRTKNSGNALNYIGKRMLVNLYGKFGQKEVTESLLQIGSKDDDGQLKVFGNEETFKKFSLGLKKEFHRSPHMMVNIAAAVTSYSRIHMLGKITGIQDTIRYTDTDSLFTPSKMESSKLLGDLKFEDDYKYGYFALPKAYGLITNKGETEIKIKGFSRKFLKTLHIDKLKALDVSSSELKVLGLKSALKRFKTPFVATEVKRSIKSGYDKRVTLPNLDTRPWFVDSNGEMI